MAATLLDRLKTYTLRSEWSANNMDGTGPRCPRCDRQQSEGHSLNNGGCELGKLCDDIRLVQRARELEPPGAGGT
jgi:hypothetical protein